MRYPSANLSEKYLFHKNWRSLFLGTLMLFLFFSTFSKAGSLSGTVVDAKTGLALPGSTVLLMKSNDQIKESVATNSEGYFRLNKVSEANTNLRILSTGYKMLDTIIKVVPGDSVYLVLKLQPTSIYLSTVEILGFSSKVDPGLAGAATKISSKEIALIQPMGTQEILQKVPGLNGFSDDGMGNSRLSIGIRGLNPRRSSRVLILEDGIPIQPAIYLYPNAYYNPPAERIDEVEVIKGSAAIQFGPQTMGGVVNYITHKPRKTFGGTVQITGGENNYRSVYTSVGGWGTSRINPELQLLYKSGDGYRDNNHFDQLNATFKTNILYDAKNSFYIKANLNQEDYNATYTGLTEYSFRTNPRFNPKKLDEFTVLRASIDVIHTRQHSDKLVSSTKYYGNYFNRNWWREKDVFVDAATYIPGGPIVPVPYWHKGGTADLVRVGNGLETNGNLRSFYVAGVEKTYDYAHTIAAKKANLKMGARVHYERFLDDRKKGFSPDAREGVFYVTDSKGDIEIVGSSIHYATTALSVFASEEFYVTKRFKLSPGVRVELFELEQINRLKGNAYWDTTMFVVLPGLGFNYELGKSNIFGGIHRGYTPPSTASILMINAGVEDKFLRPERSWNSELGLRSDFSWLSFEISAFHLYIEDMVAGGFGTNFKNLGAVRTYGLENAFSFSFSEIRENLKFLPDLNISYTWLQTNVETALIKSADETGLVDVSGNELPYAPRHTLTAALIKEFKSGLAVKAEYQYLSKVFADFENYNRRENRGDQGSIGSYYLINASINYAFKKQWNIYISGKNLMDQIYIGSRLHSNPSLKEAQGSSGIIPGARRQVNLGVKYSFGM